MRAFAASLFAVIALLFLPGCAEDQLDIAATSATQVETEVQPDVQEAQTQVEPANQPTDDLGEQTPVVNPPAQDPIAADPVEVAVADPHEGPPVKEPAAKLPRELWDVSYISGSKVGHIHTVITPIKQGEQDWVTFKQQGKLTVSRFGTPVTIGMTFASVETPDGQLGRFKSTLKLGPLPNVSEGVVRDRSLETTTSSLGKKTTKTLAWKPEFGGFFAVDQSLRSKPMQPKETREFKSLMPLATDVAIADVTLTAADYETTELLEGERELLRIEVTMKAGGPHDTEQTIWTDRQGEVMKSFTKDLGGMATYRTSREVAVRKSDTGTFDLGNFSTVKVAGVGDVHAKRKMVYRVKLKHSDPREVFSHCGSQQVESIDDNSANLTVIALGPTSPVDLPVKPTAPVDEDLQANNLIQSDDARVAAMAKGVLPDERDTFRLAVALENAVFRQMAKKNFSTAFATAAEVARSLEGDCTEHAVLLAAMCRARNIPARVAIGLVYYAPQKGFAYHMWNEVWTGERWVPLDATLGRGGIGGGHLKLTDSSLAGADSFTAFMPVAKVMGQLEIEVAE